MPATAAQITQFRRMVAESGLDAYDDSTLAGYIEACPLLDEQGEAPYTWDNSANPPARVPNVAWIPTYDLHAAAANVWEEKAAALTTAFDFSADGATYNRSQQYDMMMRQVRYHRGRRSPTSGTLIKWPPETDAPQPWVVNLFDPKD